MKRTKVKPVCLIAGGPGTKEGKLRSLFRKVFEIYGLDSPGIAYIGAASGDNQRFFLWLKEMLISAGAEDVVLVPVVRARHRLERLKSILHDMDIVFISGGDVEKGMKLLEKRELVPVLKKLFLQGVPFFGLSAGSIMLAKCWIRWPDPSDDSMTELFPCLGFAPVVCDTHGEDDDWEELRELLKLTKKTAVGYGITSSAGLIVMPGGKTKTMGGLVQKIRCYGI